VSGVDDGKDGAEVNDRVLATFLSLKEENSSCELKRIGGGYYVYLSSGRLDKETGKMKKVSIYKGRITPEGVFIPIKRKKGSVLREFAKQLKEKGAILGVDTADVIQNPNAEARSDSLKYEKTILTALSMNGRISMPALSRMLCLSVNATTWQVKSLERKYGIRYLPEIDVTKFGYMQFMLAVKFLDRAPPTSELKALLLKEPRIQLAMTVKGEYNLMMYVLAKNITELNEDILLRMSKALNEYDMEWETIPLYETYGFMPVRTEFIDFLKDRLLEREYAVLKRLNTNGNMKFSAIDSTYGFDEGRSSYSYYKLRSEGKIRRMTISLQKLPFRYLEVIIETLVNRKQFEANRAKSLSNIISDDESLTNRYAAVYDTVSPYGTMLIMPVLDYTGSNKASEELSNLDLGMKFTKITVTELIFGDFGYRRFDNAHSVQQCILEREYGVQAAQKIDYEETGRKKAEEVRLDIRGARIPKEEAGLSQILP
jgi:DNA-binding Lrp family transcriptional regulator